MAKIVPIIIPSADRPQQIRNSVAVAAAAYVDWVRIPAGTRFVEIVVDTSAVTTSILPALLAADPIIADDAHTVAVATLTTAQTSAAAGRIVVGPGVSGIANALAWGTGAGVDCLVNTVVPKLLGIKYTTVGATTSFKVSIRTVGE